MVRISQIPTSSSLDALDRVARALSALREAGSGQDTQRTLRDKGEPRGPHFTDRIAGALSRARETGQAGSCADGSMGH